MSLPKIGNKAPAFKLVNQKGEKISLTDFKDKKNVVLYFYPRALTPGCTVQACGIRDFKEEFKKVKTVVFGISPDSVEKLQKFTEKKDLNFDLLSDEDKSIAKKYGVWGLKKFLGKEYMGINRMTFIIGKDGKLKEIFQKVKTKSHHQDVFDWVSKNL